MRLPIVPLHGVLYPGATVPLHIFEPRYREMVGRCLEHDEAFGVVLILEGEEVGGPAVPHRIGTEAAIIAAQRYRDGRYDLVAEGRRRFEIVSLDPTRAYLRGEVRFLPEPGGTVSEDLAETVAILFEGFLETEERSGHPPVEETWRDLDSRALSYLIASMLPVSEAAKQEMLELRDAGARLRKVAGHLMAITRIGAKAGAA
ncbi:MAG TPA: LON peptidase substrate-binding domain-containing protein [Thermoplasmata archaeon]|nr:LON peptidase substrate-binding domain-containing protein [Thermoplasmata archaeon]